MWLTILTFSLATLLSTALSAVAQSPPPEKETIPNPSDFPHPLPSESSAPPPEPNLQTPSTFQSAECTSPATDSERFFVKKVEVLGNTVLQKEIAEIIKLFENREVTFENLICLRSEITELYLENDYITSGAFLPNNQELRDGVVQIQVVEGELERIDISGLNRLREGYVRSRLEIAATKPLNQQSLEKALELLLLDPLLEQVNADLTVGSTPGRSILFINLKEAPAFHGAIGVDNYRPPSIGSEQGIVFVSHDNVLGFGDRFSAEYNKTEGLDFYNIRYTIPVNARNGTFGLRYWNGDSGIIQEDFQRFDISSKNETFSLNFRQPVLRAPESEVALGIAVDLRREQTFLLDEPFSFSIAAEDGETKLTVIRFFQEWVKRDARQVLAVRSQFSVGINAFGSTINDLGIDGRFFSWQGQFQWVQQLSPGTLLLARIAAQLTPDFLLPLEQFSLGGVDTVRGYRQNQLLTDNGILGSVEVRIPLTSDPSVLQLTPFVDVGTGWNNQGPDPDPSTLVGIGLGLRWLISSGLSARLDYGIPLNSVDNQGNSLQENGFYFSLRYQPF